MAKSGLQWELNGLYKFLEDYYNKKCRGNYKKIIFAAITRKGYNFYKMLYKRRKEIGGENILDHFTVISDRYLSKIITSADFKRLIQEEYDAEEVLVVLFDDNFNRGKSIFYYYTLLRCWGAEVIPVVYTCTLSSEGKLKAGEEDDGKWKEFQEVCSHADHEKFVSMSEEERRDSYESYIDEFNSLFQFAKYVTSDDKFIFNQKILNCLEEETYPMAIDLPMIGTISEGEHCPLEMPAGEWYEFLSELSEKEWKIVKNIVEEPRQLKVTASYFEVPAQIAENLPSDTVFNSIVKCKYHADGEKIRSVFVPFVIMRSLDYDVLADYFIGLYRDTEYYFSVEDSLRENGNVADFRRALIDGLDHNLNLHLVLYRAVVWYFSGYIAAEFVESICSILPDKAIEYDWRFMEEHMPPELLHTIQEQLGSVKEMRRRIAYLSDQNEDVILQLREGEEAADWDHILYLGKAQLAERKYKNDDRMLSIEEFEEAFTDRFYFKGEAEKKCLITRAITAFLEESFWGNELENDRRSGRILRGFSLGECSAFLYGRPLEMIYPYVYAFYLKEDELSFEKKYPHFIEILRAFLGKEGILGSDIPECAFNFYTNFFRCKGDILREKIVNSKYILHDFLRGQNNQFQREFDWVQNLEV